MGLGKEEELEVHSPPVYLPGHRVRSKRHIKNDGTFMGRDIGEVLVKKGDVGYVRDVGMYLQRYYIYAVEFIDRGSIVGMRAKELVSLEEEKVS